MKRLNFVKISIPSNNINERKYILDIIFNEFLSLEYELEVVELVAGDWVIELPNNKILIIKDTFFNNFPNDLEYLKLENIPLRLEELDMFAASFFMLTRWEEYVNIKRDIHGRFPSYESLAYKQEFLDRPIVNEYAEELKEMLFKLDDGLTFKEQRYELFLTHDIDKLYLWKSWKQIFMAALGDIFKRRNFALALESVSQYFLIKRNVIKDPFDTFDWLMDKSEAIGVKSRFYFMSGGVTKFDNRYVIDEPKSLELIEHIKKRGHVIGFHASYNAFSDTKQFKKELDLLEKTVGQKITEGRGHYLRFEVPTTWQIWEDNGLSVDSTCGYADKEGYRCGTGSEFSVFNILSREKLKLKERALIVMDCSLFDYQSMTYREAESVINKLRKNSSITTILWHNSYIKYIDFYGYYINKIRRKL
jgi:hypothetical protein